MTKITKFLRDDAGAVTIDWVALTAGVLIVGIMAIYAIYGNGVSDAVSGVNSMLLGVASNVSIGSLSVIR